MGMASYMTEWLHPQKVRNPGFCECPEHSSTQMIFEAKASKGNPTDVRLDLANVYGLIPHPFRFRTLPDPTLVESSSVTRPLFLQLSEQGLKSVSQLAT